MTDESCISFCGSKGYTFAGTEYGQECFCDYNITSQLDNSLPGGCNMPCSGDSTELCGGLDRLSVFTTSKSSPVENSGPNGWNTLGCYTDSVSARTLSTGTAVPGGASAMTVALCTSACGDAGYHFAGVEYSDECFCDHQLENNPSSVLDGCDMVCNGNSSEYCGGSDRINIYHLPTIPPSGWTDLGCYTDVTSARSLGISMAVPGDYNNMTIEGCLGACQAAGYPLAGLEYARECFCDTTFHNGGGPAYPPNRGQGDAGCDMPCTGNPEEICGGPNRLNAYVLSASSSTTSSVSLTSTISSTSSTVDAATSAFSKCSYVNHKRHN